MTELALKIDHLDFSYDKQIILDDVCLDIEKGSFVALIGPNGGGKSTLLKLMMGLLKPKSGNVTLFNNPPTSHSSKIGYVPQSRDTDPKFPVSVLDVVLMGAYRKLSFLGWYPKKIKDKAFEALKQVNLSRFASKSFGSLSGGQAQRVLIARALMSDPDILFLDEPTASIDPETQKLVIALLKEKKSKMTIVMVTHQIQDVLSHVDSVYTVQTVVSKLAPETVCKHFTMGVYHDPLLEKEPHKPCH